MSRTPIRDTRITQPSVALGLIPSHRRGRRSAPFRHSREGENPRSLDPRTNASLDTNNHVRVKTRLARESDAAASSPPLHCPGSHHFHSLMRPSQGHGDSGSRRNPGEGCGGSTHHRPVLVTSLEKFKTTWRENNVARGLVPRLGGEQPAHTTIPRPSHPNILDTQHRYSRYRRPAPYPDTGPVSRGGAGGANLPTCVCRGRPAATVGTNPGRDPE